MYFSYLSRYSCINLPKSLFILIFESFEVIYDALKSPPHRNDLFILVIGISCINKVSDQRDQPDKVTLVFLVNLDDAFALLDEFQTSEVLETSEVSDAKTFSRVLKRRWTMGKRR